MGCRKVRGCRDLRAGTCSLYTYVKITNDTLLATVSRVSQYRVAFISVLATMLPVGKGTIYYTRNRPNRCRKSLWLAELTILAAMEFAVDGRMNMHRNVAGWGANLAC